MNRNDAWSSLQNAVETAWPIERYRDLGVVIGCSGGADSVTLLHCLAEKRRLAEERLRPRENTSHGAAEGSGRKAPHGARGFLVVAHFNHRLRGSESDGDEQLVRELAHSLGVRIETASGDGCRADEMSTRNQRREFFLKVLRQTGARYLALAHSRDDNVETVLHRLMRGTGPTGLTGMTAFKPFGDSSDSSDFVIARPFLNVSRDQIRCAARDRELRWREDQSNLEVDYQRNWIRNELLPLMETRYPSVSEAVDRAIEGQAQWKRTMDRLAADWIEQRVIKREPWIIILRAVNTAATTPSTSAPGPGPTKSTPVHATSMQTDPAVMTEALRVLWLQSGWPLQQMNQLHWKRLRDLICGTQTATLVLPGMIIATREAGMIELSVSSS